MYTLPKICFNRKCDILGVNISLPHVEQSYKIVIWEICYSFDNILEWWNGRTNTLIQALKDISWDLFSILNHTGS